MQLRWILVLAFFAPLLSVGQRLPRLIPYVKDGLFALADERQTIVVGPTFEAAFPERRGLTFAAKNTENGLRWGALDPYGKELLPFEFLEVRPLHNAVVVRTDSGYGLLGYDRKYLRKPQYMAFGDFSEGIAVVKKDSNHAGYLNIRGEEIVPPEYSYVARFRAGRGVTSKDGMQAVFDRDGKRVFQAEYHSMRAFSDAVTVFRSGERYGVIDKYGKIVVLPRYEEIGAFENGWATCKSDGKWGVLFKSGNEMLPCLYEEVRIQGEWPAAVYDGTQWALMRQGGQAVTEFRFQRLTAPVEGIAVAKDESGAWYADANGKPLLSEQFRDIATPQGKAFHGGIGAVRDASGRYALITRQGVRITDDKYEEPEALPERGPIILKQRGKIGALDRSGTQLIPFIYDEIEYLWSGIYRAVRKNATHFYDVNGNGFFEYIGD